MSRVIETEELIATFKVKIASKYPHLSLKEIERICRAEFLLIKDVIGKGEFEEVRLQYLFTLRVAPRKVMKQLRQMDLQRDLIRPNKYKEYLVKLLNYVYINEENFKRHEGKIEKYTGFNREQIRNKAYLDT